MSGLPSPEDVAVKLLVWISAPALVVTVYTSVLAALGWVSIGRSGARYTATAAQRARQTVRHWTTARQRAMVQLLWASASFVAFAYSLTQLAEVTYQKVGQQRSIAYGLTFDADYLVTQLLGYQHWTRPSAWAVVAALVSIFVLNVANLLGATPLRKFVTFIWTLVLGLGLLASLLLAVDGLCVLVLGLTHSDNYQPEMAILYALWVALLWALPWLAGIVQQASENLFRADSGN